MTTRNRLALYHANGQRYRPAWQVILLAAYALEEDHRARFSPGDLAIAAARIAPLTFCLRSAEGHLLNYPDNNRVIVELCKRSWAPGNGLHGRGYIERVGRGVYRLTDDGREAARAIVNGGNTP